MTVQHDWLVRITKQAELDLFEIVHWTHTQFGRGQADAYERILIEAVDALGAGPAIRGVRRRDDLVAGLRTLHVTRGRKKGRHLLFFMFNESERAVEVLRILHEAMDFARHLQAPS